MRPAAASPGPQTGGDPWWNRSRVHVVAADEVTAVINAEAAWFPHAVHVGDKSLDVRGSLGLSLHIVWPNPPRSAAYEHDQIYRPTLGRLVRAGQTIQTVSMGTHARDVVLRSVPARIFLATKQPQPGCNTLVWVITCC